MIGERVGQLTTVPWELIGRHEHLPSQGSHFVFKLSHVSFVPEISAFVSWFVLYFSPIVFFSPLWDIFKEIFHIFIYSKKV